jgi:acyl-coenzyme A thioesterase PaaI-like protein
MTDLRRRVLTALALDRTPGFTYSGNFLGVRFPSITPDCVRVVMDEGVHCEDEQGRAHIGAVSLLADVAMASVVRARLSPEQRLATVSLTLQFTGEPLVGALEGIGEFEAFIDGADSRQGLSRGTLTANGRPVLFGCGAFMVMNPPPGRTMHPIVDAVHAAATPLEAHELSAQEREVLARAERAIEAAGGGRGFLDHFWGLLPVSTADGARCRTANGAHIGNRVGHMQGGLQMGMAIVTAEAALSPAWVTSGISAWFMSPGEGEEIVAVAAIEHRGRNTAVVRTVLTGHGGRRVLEAMTTHLRRA